MGIFSKGEPVVLKEGSSAKAQLEALESLRGTLPSAAEKRLEADIRALRAGIAGEERILFELKNSHMDLFVIQDLYLEHDGLTAQIDFLVLTQQRFFVLECKNLYGNIEVNERGDFVRILPGRRREGMYSPVTQNKRHIDLIRAMRHDKRSAFGNLLFDSDRKFYDLYRSFVVLANPKTVLDDRRAPKEIRDKIIRADQLIESIRAVNAERGPYHDKASLSATRKDAENYLARDKGMPNVDYAAKYREMATADVVPGTSTLTDTKARNIDAQKDVNPQKPAETLTDSASQDLGVAAGEDTTPTCPRCGAPMVLRTARRGERAGKQFYGCSTYPKCRGVVNLGE